MVDLSDRKGGYSEYEYQQGRKNESIGGSLVKLQDQRKQLKESIQQRIDNLNRNMKE